MKPRLEMKETNARLLEAATSFYFSGIEIHTIKIPGAEWVEIRKSGKLYDKKTRTFVNMVNKYAVINGHVLENAPEYKFDNVYEAYGVVLELLK